MIDGLKPYRKYKDSGLPWLQEVPKHWKVRRGKALFRCIDVRSRTGQEELLTVSSERGVVPRRSANVTMFKAESYVGYKLCWPDDLVINSLWAWARGLGVSPYHGIVSSAYGVYRLRNKQQDNPRFIHQLVRSTPFQWELQVRSKGIWVSRLQLTDDAFLGAPFPMPPSDEQTAIVRFLDWADRRIRRVIRLRNQRINLLEEYKQALINRAVTGKIDVRTCLRQGSGGQAGKPYPKYKHSGVEWLGEVPGHWEVRRLRQVALMLVSNVDKHTKEGEIAVHLCNYLDVYKNERITADIKFMRATASPDEIERFRLRCGDVAITKDSETWNDIGVPALVDYEAPDLVYGYHLAILRPYRNQLVGLYLLRALQSQGVTTQLHVAANGVTRFGLSHNAIKNAQIPVPPLPEQTAIAEFLDEQTERIDAAIAADRRVIDLLKEFRTHLVADVVTGKLDVREVAAKLPDEPPGEEAAPADEENRAAGSEGDGVTDVEVESAEALS